MKIRIFHPAEDPLGIDAPGARNFGFEWDDLQARRTGNSGWRACSFIDGKKCQAKRRDRNTDFEAMRKIRYPQREKHFPPRSLAIRFAERI